MAFVRVNPPIDVDELTIREYRLSDVDQFHESVIRNKSYLEPWVSDWIKNEPITLDERLNIFREWVSTYETQSNPLGIFIANRFVGSIGLADIENSNEVEIGYWVDSEIQGQAIATRAANALTKFALTQTNVDRVVLLHKVGNEKSFRVAEKLGYKLTDTIEECGHTPALKWIKEK